MTHARVLMTALALAGVLIVRDPVGAHAFLDHSDPAVGSTVSSSPAVMHLWFTQQVEPAFSSVTVTDRSGTVVNDGPAQIDPSNRSELDVKLKPLAAGAYKVKWHVLSVDTHTTQGDFSFLIRSG